jgi:hypothetical protein
MKKFTLTFLVAIMALTTVLGQSLMSSELQRHAVNLSRLPAKHYAAPISRTTSMVSIDYDSFDTQWAHQHSATDTMRGFGWDINHNNDTSLHFSLRYAVQTYDTLIDVNNGFAGTSYRNATVTVDSFGILLKHANNSGLNDTFIISVFDKSAATVTGTGINNKLNTIALWSDTFIANTDFFPTNTDFYYLTFRPGVTLPAGHKFGIRVDFGGDINDQMSVIATYREQCADAYFADTNKIAPRNSSYYWNYNTLSGFKNYTTNYALNAPGCPFFYIQNYLIYPMVTVTTSSLTASATATPTTCGQSNGTATVTASGCTGTPTYAWSTSPTQTTATATNLPAGTYTVTVTCNGTFVTASATVGSSSGVTANATSTATTCGLNNGTATVTAQGTGTLTYTWSTSPAQTTATATGLAAGSYTVTVSNGTCSATATTSVAASTGVTATATATSSTCGAATGTATAVPGGTCSAGFTYAWNTTPTQTTVTATNLPAGVYTVTVSCGNCSATASATVSNPGAPTASISGTTNPLCAGAATGTATVTATGPVTYAWSTTPTQTTATATGLAAGNYTVTVSANGCQTILQVTIVDPARIIASATSNVSVSCFGGSNGTATVTASGGTGALTYAWSTTPTQTTATATGLTAGNYTVTVTDANGCSVTSSATVAGPASALTASTSVSGSTATVTAAGGTPTYTYAWSTTPTQTAATATGLTAGNYTVTVTDSKNCTATASVTILGVESVDAGVADFSVYPNPSNGNFTAAIKMTSVSDVTITVMDIAGRKVFESTDKSVKDLNKAINLSNIATGSYIINVRTDRGTANQRIVIQ